MKTFSSIKTKLLKDSEVAKEYRALGPEFALVKEIIGKRLERGLTQKQLADKIGTKQPVISRLEQGNYNPSLKFLRRVAKALKADLHIQIK